MQGKLGKEVGMRQSEESSSRAYRHARKTLIIALCLLAVCSKKIFKLTSSLSMLLPSKQNFILDPPAGNNRGSGTSP